MKNLFLAFITFLFAFQLQAQNVTGSWKGTMVQDSPRRSINFELAIKEKDGKLFGYCYRLFIVNDSLIYNTVKIEARITDSVLIIEDEQSVSKNFEEKANKIKVVYFFKLNKNTNDQTSLSGEWTTNRYKKYMAITGTVQINKEPDFTTTQLFKRLEEKKLHKEMIFEVKTNASSTAALTAPATVTPGNPVDTIQTIAGKTGNETKQPNTKPSDAVNQPKQNLPTAPVVTAPVIMPSTDSSQTIAGTIGNDTKVQNNQPAQAVIKPKQNLPAAPVVATPVTIPSADTAKTIAGTIGNNTKIQNNQPPQSVNQPTQKKPAIPVVNKPTVLPVKDSTQVIASTQNKPATNQTKPTVTAPVEKPKQQPVVTVPPTQQPTVKTETKPVVQKPTTPVVTQPTVVVNDKPQVDINKVNETNTAAVTNKPVVMAPPPVINNPTITKRETEIIQAVDVTEDSVVLSLYDNGEIDGDTVSVFVNNELVVAKVGLSAKAFKKTIYFKVGETVQLTFFAENLGSIPPNTGLLVIYTSTERHQVFFSSNYNKSSSILLRRKE